MYQPRVDEVPVPLSPLPFDVRKMFVYWKYGVLVKKLYKNVEQGKCQIFRVG